MRRCGGNDQLIAEMRLFGGLKTFFSKFIESLLSEAVFNPRYSLFF